MIRTLKHCYLFWCNESYSQDNIYQINVDKRRSLALICDSYEQHQNYTQLRPPLYPYLMRAPLQREKFYSLSTEGKESEAVEKVELRLQWS